MLNKTIKYFLAVASIAASTTVNATSIQIISTDGPGEGFNSAAAVEPVTGNDARTLGEQYTNVFRAAADFFEGKIISDIDILIEAAFDPLRCEANTAQLGGAGRLLSSTRTFYRLTNFFNARQHRRQIKKFSLRLFCD